MYVDRSQRAFLAQMMSFVVPYDVIYHSFPINSQYLMMWGVDSPEGGGGVGGWTPHMKVVGMLV